MSADFGVYFAEAKHPIDAEWQASCIALKFPVVFEEIREEKLLVAPRISWGGGEFGQYFHFEITPDAVRNVAAMISDENPTFAHFNCSSETWEIACKLAIGFMKAADGVFHSPEGSNFWTTEGAIGDFCEGEYHLRKMIEEQTK